MLLAQCCAIHLRVPMVLASTFAPATSSPETKIYSRVRRSGGQYSDEMTLHISSDFLGKDDRVLIIDDVLSTGATASVLVNIIEESGATLVGFGLMIEKAFDCGRDQVTTKCQNWIGGLLRRGNASRVGITALEN